MRKVYASNLFFLTLVILQLLGAVVSKLALKSFPLPIWLIIVGNQLIFLILPIVVYFKITGQSVRKVLKLNKLNISSIILTVIISILVMPIGSFLGLVTNLFFHNNVVDVLAKINYLSLISLIIIMAITPAVCEELAIRGVVLSGYENISIKKSAIITGLFFSILHMNPSQFLYTFVLGIILAYLVHVTGSIFSSMICHFIFNVINVIIMWNSMRYNVKAQEISSLPVYARAVMIVSLFIIALVCAAIIYLLMKKLYKINKFNEDSIIDTNQTISFISKSIEDVDVIRKIDYLPAIGGILISLAYVIFIVY